MSELPVLPSPGGIDLARATGGAINGTDAQLIWELVAQISKPEEVLERYGMTPADLRHKLKDKMFRAAYREAKSLWNSDLNVEERIKLKARYMVEDSILDLFKVMKDPNISPSVKMEAFSQLVRVGDLGPKKDAVTSRPFSIVMQFSNTDKKVVIDGRTLPPPADVG